MEIGLQKEEWGMNIHRVKLENFAEIAIEGNFHAVVGAKKTSLSTLCYMMAICLYIQ